MGRRKGSTIGASPLDAVVPKRAAADEPGSSGDSRVASAEASLPEKAGARQRRVHSEGKPGGKERLTVHVPQDLVDRVKNAVYWTPGLTLARLSETALLAEVERLEKERGEAYPPRTEELRGGRPMK
jgi:hypothetical protein